MHAEPPNNPLKLPTYLVGVLVGVLLIVVGAVEGPWPLVAVGVVVLVIASAASAVVRRGRNPWWTRTPLDYRRRRP